MKENGGQVVLLTGQGIESSGVPEAYVLPMKILSKADEASTEGRGRRRSGLNMSSYSDDRYLSDSTKRLGFALISDDDMAPPTPLSIEGLLGSAVDVLDLPLLTKMLEDIVKHGTRDG
jgi:hypothetical protein